MGQNKTLLYGVDDKPPLGITLLLALQYTLLNIGGMMLSPLIISAAVGLDPGQTEYLVFVTLLVGSISTFIQVARVGNIGSGYLMVLGPSGAFIACSISAVSMGGLPLLGTMTLITAPVEALISYLIRFFRKVFTPALGGTVIMLVAILLLPLTIELWSGTPDDPLYGSNAYLLTGLAPLLVIFGSYLSDRTWVRLWSPLMGIGLGVVVAEFFGIADFARLAAYPLVALPRSGWPGLEVHLTWHHLPLFIVFLMATLTSTIETFGDTVALQTVSEGKLDKIQYDRVQGGLYVDAVGSMLGGLSGSIANTTYSNVMPVIQLTRVSSRRVGYFTALILGLVAFLPKIAYFFICIPEAVMGGLGVSLMAILFGEGFKVASSAELSTENAIVVGTGISMGVLAGIGKFFPGIFPEQFQFLSSDVLTAGGISALILNVLFIYKVRKTENLVLPADLGRLSELHEKINSFEDRFRLTERQKYALQLATEEVFAFYCSRNPEENRVTYRWKYHPEYIITEIFAQGELSDVDVAPDPGQVRQMDDEDLKDLGLLLLAKVATNIEHAVISGRHYIQFRV